MFAGIGSVKLRYQKLIRKRWPQLSHHELVIRNQKIETYRLITDPNARSENESGAVLYILLYVTFGIALGGYLINDFNLGFIPLTALFFEGALIFLTERQLDDRNNRIYQQYIRTHLNNDL